jgi:hypothetical protein
VFDRIHDWYARTRAMTKLALVLIVGSYVASFFMPVLQILSAAPPWVPPSPPMDGWGAFELIAEFPSDPDARTFVFILPWFANPALWFGLIGVIKERSRWVLTSGCIAFFLSLCAFVDPEEMAFKSPGFLYGYYAWAGSMFATAWYGFYLVIAAPPLTPPRQTTAASGPSDCRCSSR